MSSSNLEKKIDKSVLKGFNKATRFLQKPKPKDLKQLTLDAEIQRADEAQFRAETLSVATKTIETSIVALAEKWKPQMTKLYNDVEHFCRQHGKAPEILSVVLVNTLIQSYETEWKLRTVSEKWDHTLWQETGKLLSNMHGHNTEETDKVMEAYRNEVGGNRDRDVEEMDAFVDRLGKQLERIAQLEADNASLQEKQQEFSSSKKGEIAQLEKKQDYRTKELLAQTRNEHTIELNEQENRHKTELEITREEYGRSAKEAKDEFHREKVDLQRQWRRSHEQEIKELEGDHKAEIKRYKNQCKQLALELEESQQNVEQKIEEAKAEFAAEERKLLADLDKRNAAFKDTLSMVERNAEAEKQNVSRELNMKILNLKLQMEDMEESHIEGVRIVEQRHIQGRKTMEQSNKEAFEKQEQNHALEITQLKESFQLREEELEVRFQKLQKEAKAECFHLKSEIDSMKEDHRIEKQLLNTAHEREKEEHEREREDLESQVKEEKARLRNEYAKKKAQLEAVHAESTTQLKNDVEAYSAALLARDDFKPMADNEIKAKFADLTEDVKTLGRLEWKAEQKVWTAPVLRRLSGDNTSAKLFKRQILQEMIWIILHKYIFCSPFRPFGEEGQILETKWNDAYGADAKFENGCYVWPMPDMEAERWRYVNVKECRNALRQAVDSEWDPRAKLKMGFRSTMEDIRDEFIATVGDMVDLEKSHIQAMDKITKKAAIVWLEYGMQRCRIVMVFGISSLKPVQERMRQARVGSIELVVVPELRRYGNSKGLDLHTEATVTGCSGEKIPVSMSH